MNALLTITAIGLGIATPFLAGNAITAVEPPPSAVISMPQTGQAPNQVPCSPWRWRVGDCILSARAAYAVTARAASIQPYVLEADSNLIPFDFALAWGKCIEPSILKSIHIDQFSRRFSWQLNEEVGGLSIDEAVVSMANTHFIPKDQAMFEKMKQVHQGDVLQVRGYLVDIEVGGRYEVDTSLSRDDTGDGACEILWVEALEIIPWK